MVAATSLGKVVTELSTPRVTTYQETSGSIAYRGSWSRAGYQDYLGRGASSSNSAGATATFRFTGIGIVWIGPTGPTRGKAKVYIDGRNIRTIDTFSRHFVPSRVLYSSSYKTEREHTFVIEVLGTTGHPTVALDAFVVRSTGSPAPAPAPTPTPTPPTSATPDPTPSFTPDAGTSGVYGPGIGADALANTQVGGTDCGCANSSTSYRFRASTSSNLNSVRIYLMSGSGYAGGDGGTMSISVQADDGSASHAPSGTVLASAAIRPGNPVSIGYLPLVTFSSPATLTAGQLYHLVFRNTDPSPTVNYVSVNALWTSASTTPRQPRYADLDWGQLINPGSGWQPRGNYTPILALNYANGASEGMGYMESWINAPKTISGSNAVREVFTPTASHSVSSVWVRVRRLSGASPLTVRLETGAGGLVEQTTIPASAIAAGKADGTGATWASVAFSSAHTLTAGASYHLVLSAPSDSSYAAFALERGNNYHFDAATYFSDGYGQYTSTGSSWSGFDQPGGSSNNTNSDLQFVFR